MTEFISRNYGKEGYEIIIKTDSHEHYRATEKFARRLIDHSKPVTNADKIRAMSDEELAEFLRFGFVPALICDICGNRVSDCNDNACRRAVLDWLQQPCEGGE